MPFGLRQVDEHARQANHTRFRANLDTQAASIGILPSNPYE